ncbi:hypothetical protein BB560_006102 [Smittium megazygosporum]|uniref:t-SNARE coiled-coil homology domain-containing protein n=1 Tax=Smittium megazygosporum TaxID=133381 RepID=A0A2T9YHK2_9FUNG|nr:hypothetical protein BB560_006102 [Smittium megazygosporum]
MLENEFYLSRALVRLESFLDNDQPSDSNKQVEFNNDQLFLDTSMAEINKLYEQIKIHYAELDDENWTDIYKKRIQSLEKAISSIGDEPDEQVTQKFLNHLDLQEILETKSSSADPTIEPMALDERKALLTGSNSKDKDFENQSRDLDLHKNTQEELANELLEMSKILKTNVVSFGEILEKDQLLVEETSDLVLKNSTVLEKQGSRLNKFRAESWKTTGFTWIVVAIVVLVFSLLLMIIKVVPKR